MNNNDFNDFNLNGTGDAAPNGEGKHAEQTSYTTPGGSGVHYHAETSRREWEGSYREQSSAAYDTERRQAYRGARITAVLIVILCIALGFGAGMAGSVIIGMIHESSADTDDMPRNVDDSSPRFETSGDGTVINSAPNASVLGDDRNPSPQMNKSDSLGNVTYSGSAGENAYSTLSEAIEHVAATVVEISTETRVNGGWLGNYVSSGAGSGVVISSDGYIVTNNHVIAGADTITVRTTDGTTYEAALIGTDSASDIAVLWIDTAGGELQAAQLGCSADLIVGEMVFAIGNPLGSLGGTVTDGIISATARSITIDGANMTLLQTNAAVNPGNSGGGLFNMAGQLIGVVNAKCSEDDVEGLGFAIPIDTAYDVINQLIEYGYVRGVVDAGLSLYDITSSNIMAAWRYFNSSYAGVYILESAYTDELKYGDLLDRIDGVKVTSSEDVEALLSTYEVGDTVTLTVVRAETEYQVKLTLREYVPSDLNVQFTQK
ncbi:MAG: trypsin-like peptidase domain-containing protein [Clostridia bacterium]|nr:trypsin-like peptidase domain-containing protein [Clostridia bacterium]